MHPLYSGEQDGTPLHEGALPGITLAPSFRFRRGQESFLRKLVAGLRRGRDNHLGVFVPGYGKTITALASFVTAHAMGKAEKLVVFVPRGNLRDQYADPEELGEVFSNLGAPPFSFCVADSDQVFLKNLDTQIVITTYQYASGENGNAALRRFCQTAPCMFVFDEVHHLAEDGTWAQSIDNLDFSCSVALSGTPIRSDNKMLFGVPFKEGADGEQYYEALHEITMRDAHEEGGILKRVEAHVIDYQLRMVRSDTGEEVEMSLSEMMQEARTSKEVDAFLARKRLRFHEVYLESLLAPAFEKFAEKRTALRKEKTRKKEYTFRNHQMLVIAMSNRHAAAMLDFIKERFPQYITTRIGQDIPAPDREERLDAYREGRIDVMVQVDMIGEGTDIKPISVIVKADLVRAYSKTMQQVFRGMRYFKGFPASLNLCDIYAANDSDVVRTLEWITSEEQAGIRIRKKKIEDGDYEAPPGAPSEQSPWELLEVRTQGIQSHNLEHMTSTARRRTNGNGGGLVDVNQREKELRQSCAALANEVAFALQAAGEDVDIRDVHFHAKQRFKKSQSDLSIRELARKKQWLERCLQMRRLI